MIRRIYHALFAILMIIHNSVVGQFTSTPQNQAVLKTTQPTFTCFSDQDSLYMAWLEKRIDSPIDSTLTVGGNLLPSKVIEGYILDKSNNKFDLTPPVDDIRWAGDYRCQVVYPSTTEATAKLTVLESDPVCTSNITGPAVEGETVSYTCDMAYRGDLYPKMQWSTNLRSIDDTTDESVDGERTKVFITVIAIEANNGWTYKCHTYFDAPTNPDPGYATNAPDYESRYESPTLEVHWSPRKVAITPDKPSFLPGEVLTCSGESNPEIDFYIWEIIGSSIKVIQEGPDAQDLVIVEEWAGTIKTLRCTVQNTMRNGIQTGETIKSVYIDYTPTLPTTIISSGMSTTAVHPSSTSLPDCPPCVTSMTTTAAVGGVLSAIIVGLLVIIVGMQLRWNRHHSKSQTRDVWSQQANSRNPGTSVNSEVPNIDRVRPELVGDESAYDNMGHNVQESSATSEHPYNDLNDSTREIPREAPYSALTSTAHYSAPTSQASEYETIDIS